MQRLHTAQQRSHPNPSKVSFRPTCTNQHFLQLLGLLTDSPLSPSRFLPHILTYLLHSTSSFVFKVVKTWADQGLNRGSIQYKWWYINRHEQDILKVYVHVCVCRGRVLKRGIPLRFPQRRTFSFLSGSVLNNWAPLFRHTNCIVASTGKLSTLGKNQGRFFPMQHS